MTFAMPVLYPLSMGPASWLMDTTRSELVKTCVDVIYKPVGFVFYSSRP